MSDQLKIDLQRLIVYANGSDPELQREVAERLANEAVKRASTTSHNPDECPSLIFHSFPHSLSFSLLSFAAERQLQIVEFGGLDLLVPLTRSEDPRVQRLAVHALANLSVHCVCHADVIRPFRGRGSVSNPSRSVCVDGSWQLRIKIKWRTLPR